MRFLTFVKDNYERQTDPDFHAFEQWIFKSAIGRNNTHAGVPQIILFVKLHNPSPQVKKGFAKWCVAYFHEPENMLPNTLKNDLQRLVNMLPY
ncbi:MAG: hypothetical protein A3D31_01140 [Candidatus Fluviicola riflensis]|nr:MAG: hypothetical protein CHH17_04400 [Candidatus Fluviicola riflensis]OGS76211.1 MAG: hypothetical protein A3D31_01140 [Candidatus Fluviicola riflensis]OGS83245.1 MAG: hypothetical protein A2724_00700 [Fluviicola sp. RIFCSPHIGHO2_01_FULL_43_53]OGS83743.1 MAG: hypothetical protein A3E30_17745 [Fluviicola sp. RIFCSPHIGHO2_12_FULL_43_24]